MAAAKPTTLTLQKRRGMIFKSTYIKKYNFKFIFRSKYFWVSNRIFRIRTSHYYLFKKENKGKQRPGYIERDGTEEIPVELCASKYPNTASSSLVFFPSSFVVKCIKCANPSAYYVTCLARDPLTQQTSGTDERNVTTIY